MVPIFHDPPSHGRPLEVFYLEELLAITEIAIREYELPELEAEALAHHILMGNLRHIRDDGKARIWLTAALRYAAPGGTARTERNE